MHHTITERFHHLCCPALRHALSAEECAAKFRVTGNADHTGTCKCGIGRSGPIHMKLPESKIIAAYTQAHDIVVGAGWRQGGTVQIGWKDSTVATACVETLLCCAEAAQHSRTIEGTHLGS